MLLSRFGLVVVVMPLSSTDESRGSDSYSSALLEYTHSENWRFNVKSVNVKSARIRTLENEYNAICDNYQATFLYLCGIITYVKFAKMTTKLKCTPQSQQIA